MKKYLSKLIYLIFLFSGINFLILSPNTYAGYLSDDDPSYDYCNRESGGLAGSPYIDGGGDNAIRTIWNVCGTRESQPKTNWCVLWLGSNNSDEAWYNFQVSTMHRIPATFYGMCTKSPNYATNVHITDTSGNRMPGLLINSSGRDWSANVARCEWGKQKECPTNGAYINLEKFKEYGAQMIRLDEYGREVWELEVILHRCHTNSNGTSNGSCGTQPQLIYVTYPAGSLSAISSASANNNSVTTGIVNSSAQVNASVLKVNSGASVNITFSHNLYSSSKKTEQTSWEVHRDFYMGLDGNSGPTSGKTAFIGLSDGKYIADTRTFNLNGTSYVSGGSYNVTFSQTGFYKFCESITADLLTTQACVSIQVGEGNCTGTECECYGTNCSGQRILCAQAGSDATRIYNSYQSSNSMRGTTTLGSWVRNMSLTNSYSTLQKRVYAKPTDTVNWCHAYYPGVQKAANSNVTHNNDDPEPDEGVYNSNTLYDHTFAGYSDWRNRFDITSSNVNPYYSYSASFSSGMSDPKEVQNKDRIELGQAGEILYEQISSDSPASAGTSNGVNHTWACHWEENCDICGESCEAETTSVDGSTSCSAYICEECYVDTCYHDNLFYSNYHGGTPTTETSHVYVPYNFTNTATVSIKNSYAYAGETITIRSSDITVHQKNNNTTQGTYATQVDSAKSKLIGYLSSSSGGSEIPDHGSSNICSAVSGRVKDGLCHELNSYTGETYNEDANMSGSTDELQFSGQSYNVYDAKAGDYYCVVVAVYPHTSGSDTNLSVKGNDKWYVSAPSCKIIAKRPSFQVWGGSVYSNKSIQTSIAQKNNLKSIYGYTITGKGNTTIFGSWAEQSIVANGIAKGIASGAATGNLSSAPYGGSKEGTGVNYCTYRVPLSFANYSKSTASGSICPSYQQTGNVGVNVKDVATDRDKIIDYWNTSNTQYSNKSDINPTVDYLGTTDINGNPVRYTEVSSTISQVNITGATIPKGITHIIRAAGSIMINGNLTYQSTTYRTQKDIPKLLIYSEKDITINCAVTRVDAILVAKGKVTTCNSTSYSSSNNSNQLTINGMVIADSMVLNRSYGAATGRNSSVPAEIVNYDTSAFVWGKGMADAEDFETLTTVYQHEIAPRY